MIRINQLKMPIDYKEKDIEAKISKMLRVGINELQSVRIHKRSLDARKKPNLFYVMVVDVMVKDEKTILKNNPKLEKAKRVKYVMHAVTPKTSKPIIVGFGPAGIFAAYILAKGGQNPIILEQGEDVDKRTLSVDHFWETGELKETSNVQFGEGGAGTFSDGKLTTRSKDIRAQKVLEILVEYGAPEEILYSNKPHVGTDILKNVVKNIRKSIIEMGGEIHFETKVLELIKDGDVVKGVKTDRGDFNSDQVILAIGHSARDTYEVLYDQGVQIEQKPFAMGVRIEHHQEMIDLNQYGSVEAGKIVGASDYKLTHKTSNGRSVYSFCVCPGGMVVASASEAGGIVVNGMSEHARNQKNINAALLVQINTEDFQSTHPLAGIEFQRKYERLAFGLTEGYRAPAQTVGSFMANKPNVVGDIVPSHQPEVMMTSLDQCLPSYVVTSLKEGITAFSRKIKGFDNIHAVLTGVESRSSAPIRMLRDAETSESLSLKGLFPIGEGAGYAGGIVSSAIDGIKVAEIVGKI